MILISCLCLLVLIACENDRPPGYLRAGPVGQFAKSDYRYLPTLAIIIHQNNGKLRAMSTMNPTDLEPLRLTKDAKGRTVLVSSQGDTFSLNGERLSGKDVRNLPYYRVRINQESGSEIVYVVVGERE